MNGEGSLSESQREWLVQTRIRQITPAEEPSRAPGERPRAVILGGQPGSGKSSSQRLVQDELGQSRTALYDGDDHAKRHPLYGRIAKEHPFDGQRIVEQHLPYDLHQRCMDHLRAGETKYDVVASHPLGRKDWAEGWVRGFSDEGYHVSVAFVATHDSNSLLGIADRYQSSRDEEGVGRWLRPEAHDRFYSEIPDVAHYLESRGLVDSMYVTNRDGGLLYENHRGPDGNMRDALGARDTIVRERAREPTAAEVSHFASRMAYLRDPERLGPDQEAEPVHPLVSETAAEAERRHREHRLESAGRKGPSVSETTLPEALREAVGRDAERIAGPGRETPEPRHSPEQSSPPSPAPSPPPPSPTPEPAPERVGSALQDRSKDLDAKLERIRRERLLREESRNPVAERDNRRHREASDDLGREALEPER
ncbi:zeta toxin family protein [Nocardiopsis dassonvillei]|uniref:zeta toxin family protein n=1 Tax=Nocardiopsis dassonvillei TaxID=2014 RepID=UPI00366AEBEA